jgi:phosphopantothenoylcysteine decarboxylase/phosphopantothenate--cysteine ligase
MSIAEIFGSKGSELSGKRILIGVTGSIAAIEVPHLVREILRYSGEPVVVLSEEATRFVTPESLTWCMDKEPITKISGLSEHVKWVSTPKYKVDIGIICPATANTIAKLANGVADGPVTLAALSIIGAQIPLLVVPIAHTVLLENPITKKNILYLKKQGIHFLSGVEEEEKYKFPSLNQLLTKIIQILQPSQQLQGKRFLVTGGATREYLDDIRFISNPSTGYSALQLAKALKKFGANIHMILGEGNNLDLEKIPITVDVVRSTKDMYEAVREVLSTNNFDGFISVAAVSDYKPQYQAGKIASRQKSIILELAPTIKIIEQIRNQFPDLFIVAYKAEVGISKEQLIERGKNLLNKYNLNVVCANWVGEPEKGFVSKTNEIFVIRRGVPIISLEGSKSEIGDKISEIIIEEVFNMRKN